MILKQTETPEAAANKEDTSSKANSVYMIQRLHAVKYQEYAVFLQ